MKAIRDIMMKGKVHWSKIIISKQIISGLTEIPYLYIFIINVEFSNGRFPISVNFIL